MNRASRQALNRNGFLVFGVWLVSLAARWPAIGKVHYGMQHIWLTLSTSIFARSWFIENPWSTGWTLFAAPPSIELTTAQLRDAYSSYFIGAVLPVYWLAKLLNTEPNVLITEVVNIGAHLGVALLILATVLRIEKVLATPLARPFVLLGPAFYLLWRTSLQRHTYVYFSDTAVILPYAAALFILLNPGRRRPATSALLFGVCLAGMATDWFFAFFLFFAFLVEAFFTGGPRRPWTIVRKAAYFGAPILIVAVLFALQVWKNGTLPFLLAKFDERSFFSTGQAVAGADSLSMVRKFFNHNAGDDAEISALAVVAGIVGLFRTAKAAGRMRYFVRFMLMTCGAGVAHLLVFFQHAAVHSFSWQKFIFIDALLLPFAAGFLMARLTRFRAFFASNYLAWAVVCGLCAAMGWKAASPCWEQGQTDPALVALGKATSSFDFHHVVYSPNIQVDCLPPHQIYFSRKKVYPAATPAEASAKLAALHLDGAEGIFLVLEDAGPEPIPPGARIDGTHYRWTRLAEATPAADPAP